MSVIVKPFGAVAESRIDRFTRTTFPVLVGWLQFKMYELTGVSLNPQVRELEQFCTSPGTCACTSTQKRNTTGKKSKINFFIDCTPDWGS